VARQQLERTAQQSLIDRLVDYAPRESGDATMTWSHSLQLLKQSLKRDLDWLLNTRRTGDPVPEEFVELRGSLHDYGLEDISSMSRDDSETRPRLLRSIEQAITDFEPRLGAVRVSLVDEDDDPTRREVHFLIEAMLRVDPSPEPVVFDTVLEVGSGEYHVKGDAGA
jgi:type VI secretion system protein ImpF